MQIRHSLAFAAPLVGPTVFALFGVAGGSPLAAQTATLALEASRTSLVVETTTPVEVFARFVATAAGVRLVSGTFDSPVASALVLTVNESAMQLAAEYTYSPTQSQPVPSAALDALFPAGGYTFHIDWKQPNGTVVHGNFAMNSAVGWPATPVVQSPQPLLPLPGATVEFTWLPWSNAPEAGGMISFTLYEGLLTVELIQQIAAGDYSGLSTFTLVDSAPSLAATATTRTTTGIDPELDHALILDFSSRTIGGSVPSPSEARSSRMVTFFYRDHQTTYAEWRAAQFPEADRTNDAVSGPEADPDQDGVANLLEYACVMQPLVMDSAGLPKPLLVEGVFVFDYGRSSAAIDLTWSYEQLMEDNTWQVLAPGSYTETTVATGLDRRTVRVTPTSGDARKLVRLRVTLTSGA